MMPAGHLCIELPTFGLKQCVFGFLISHSPLNQNADSNLSEYNHEGESEF